MQVEVSTRHGELSEVTQKKITEKVEKLQRYFERLMSINVTVDLEKPDEPKIEVIVTPEHKHDFVASHQSKDMFASLDHVIAKLEQQIKKYKEKIQDHNKQS
jgi:putative sigma-54 modulation protein